MKDTTIKWPATDYCNMNNWLRLVENPVHEVDLLYFYPTMTNGNGSDAIAQIDDNMRKKASVIITKQADFLDGFTNVFAPFYRQLTPAAIIKSKAKDDVVDMMKDTAVERDVFAALDRFFQFYNHGRPFVLLGHSQGAMVILLILSLYFKNHPELCKRMIAAYAIGYGVTSNYLSENPHLRFAKGRDDTGVIVSWNTEGPGASAENIVLPKQSIAINPLNWKLDETPASIEENRGSLMEDPMTYQNKIVAGIGDAVIDMNRGVVICKTRQTYIPNGLFGDRSLHNEDLSLYLENTIQNVYDRITTYLGYKPFAGMAKNYTNRMNWMCFPEKEEYPVDLFYLYPTVIRGGESNAAVFPNQIQKNAAQIAFSVSGAAFEGAANIYAPYYHQLSLEQAMTVNNTEQYGDLLRRNAGIHDVFAALDYYFENCNKGKPFLFAAHGQGSAVMKTVLDEYMKKHPDYMERFVAAYVPGFSFDKDYFLSNPHLKAAMDADDTQVIISWNTVASVKNSESVMFDRNSCIINPLNWRTDNEPADVSQNTGSMIKQPYGNIRKSIEHYADAQIDPAKGSLICSASCSRYEPEDLFGNQSLHHLDWALYFNNIRDNARHRIQVYFDHQSRNEKTE